jgi:site-specific recombinase XerD
MTGLSRYCLEWAVSPNSGRTLLIVVDATTYIPHRAAKAFAIHLQASGKSPNTSRVYLPRIARFLNWGSEHSVEWTTIGLAALSRYKNCVETTPIQNGSLPTGKTVNAALTTVCEFLRFSGIHGFAEPEVASRFSEPRVMQFLPAGFNPGEGGQFRNIRARILKAPEIDLAPKTVAAEDQDQLEVGARSARDRFLLSLLFDTGIRIGEALGLRRGDLHMLPSSIHLGCSTRGPHVHVTPRQDNINGARVKGGRPRIIPLSDLTVRRYAECLEERDEVPDSTYSDYLFINLRSGPYVGQPASYSNIKQIIERLGVSRGVRVRPHMARHTAATRWIRQGARIDVVQVLLGHASQQSTAIYTHARDEDLRAAVDNIGATRK